ncbi:unnamed protein product [Durusdinium trenchii]|uniref:Uncharacterized protein n=1 Tax=Durusdinium trenchii TaxID=1381693 RepID=A0ABP0L2B8_9DINO
MRIFIHNVDSYIGRALVKELRKADGGLNRIFGTVKSGSSAPPAVKRVVCRDDPKKAKKMAETMQSCRLVVISLNDCSLEDLHFAITALKVDPKVTPPKVLGELESEVIFLVISSAIKDGPHGSLDAAAGVRACENGGLQDGGRCQVSR